MCIGVLTLEKIAVIALTLSLISYAFFAQATPPTNSGVQPIPTPAVVIAGVGGIFLGAFGLLLLAGLGGGSSSSISAQS